MSSKKDMLYDSVWNYTKYKLVEMLIEKYKDKKMDNMNQIEQLADDICNVLTVAVALSVSVLSVSLVICGLLPKNNSTYFSKQT